MPEELRAARTAAVILAAGGGSRYLGATHKLLAVLHGRTVVEHAVANAHAAGLAETVVVSGAVTLPHFDPSVVVLHNPHWANGQATSLQVALAHVRSRGHDAMVVGLGDQPFLPADAWRAVAAATDTALAMGTYADGTRGQPVRIAASLWDELPVEGDEGARSLLQWHRNVVTQVACPGTPADIDTVEDLQRWS
jgi:molybdenum cofactor cytidylyltransferase